MQSLPYTPDNVTTKFDEYPRYPIETLADNGGDCEDASILTAALLSNMGYKVILISPPEHMAVGIHIEGAYGSYYEIEGRKYFYLETTGKGWKIGEIPEEYRGAEVKIYQLIPKPVLTHKWTALQRGYVLTLNVTVKNVGTAAANNVKVYAAFDAGEGHVYNPKESKSFNLNADAEAEITLYLDVPREKHTRLIVKILSNIYLMDTSYSEWFQT
ncbi:MAG: hypothetical protein HY930_03890 [Euryarchaeota archaeon]|nr:hypothetical protein [Euryarchaeota archaeon]